MLWTVWYINGYSSPHQKAPKEPILEEAELDFRPLEESEEYTERDESEPEQTKDADMDSRHEVERSDGEEEMRHDTHSYKPQMVSWRALSVIETGFSRGP